MIKRIEIQGYKCLRDVSVALEPFTVLIGPNDSGKSSFLQALSLPWHPPAPEVFTPGFALGIFGETAKATVGRGDTKVSYAYESGGEAVAESRVREVMNKAGGQHNGQPVSPLPTDLYGLTTTRPLVLDARRVWTSSSTSYANLAYIISNQGSGVSAHLARLALSDRGNFDAIQKAMLAITNGRVAEVLVDDNGSGQYSLSFQLYDGAVIPGSELSAGLLMYLGFLAILHRRDAPGVLLVEEPENGLHPLRLREVVGILRKLTERGVQVVCTTHSPDLLSSCEPHEVRVFRRPDRDSGTEVRKLPAHFDRIAMRQSIGEVWASRGEEGLLDELPGVEPTVHAEAS